MLDFVVSGAGMVGAATALGLVQQGYRVGIVEANMPPEFDPQQPPDLRMSAINQGSVTLLQALGAWPFIEAMRLRSYEQLSVWEDPNCRTDFHASEVNAERLGYFVENRLIQLGCHQALAQQPNLEWFCGQSITALDTSKEQQVDVTLSNGEVLTCRWVIGAEGARSPVRSMLGIGLTGWNYAQSALGIIIECEQTVAGTTWQQFYPSGPRALLPMYDNYAALIWYDEQIHVDALSKLPPAKLKEQVLKNFPPIEADFNVLSSAPFGLTRQHAQRYVTPHGIILGDAAHTINPLAGQGVNLGFKDVSTLLSVTKDLVLTDRAATYQILEQQFATPRRRDNQLMMSAMDAFYVTFSNTVGPLKWLRNQALWLAGRSGPIKGQVLQYAMGLK